MSSLKSSFFDGLTGLHQQTANAFNAGLALVGSSEPEVTDLDLGNVNGAALTTAGTGKYFDISSVTVDYRVWFKVSVETAPSAAGRTLVEVDVAGGDTVAQVAAKLQATVNLIAGQPLSVENEESVVVFTTSLSGPALTAPSVGTLGGTALIQVLQAGVVPSGQFTTLQQGLVTNAAAGNTSFTVNVTTTYLPATLRGNKGNNFILKAYFAGIQQGLGLQQIYPYECALSLNVSDTVNTSVDFIFTF